MIFLCLLFFRHGASAAKAGVPRTGRRVQANSTILSCGVEVGQTKCPSLVPQFNRCHSVLADVIVSRAVLQAERRILPDCRQSLDARRFLAPQVKARGLGMTRDRKLRIQTEVLPPVVFSL